MKEINKPMWTYQLPSREIKFRAWDSISSVMLDWRIIMQTAFNRKNFSLLYELFTSNTLIKMQYTWLKDKNWVEIYEGDIVTYDGYDVKYYIPVEYIIDKWTIWMNWWNHIMLWEYTPEDLFNDDEIPLSEQPYYVVWNIFENPELLNEDWTDATLRDQSEKTQNTISLLLWWKNDNNN